jgi:type IX secretion system PorP/SprF family membrane protein
MKKVIIKFLFVFTFVIWAQDVHFSQFNESALMINPAHAGFFNGYFRAGVMYRDQWAAMGKAFQTVFLSVDGGLFKNKKRNAFMGIGGTIFQDRAGFAAFRRLNALVHLSGVLKLNKKHSMSAGICGGALNTNANYQKLTFASQFDGNKIDKDRPNGENVFFRPFTTTDVGAGIAYYFQNLIPDNDQDDLWWMRAGVAAYHINRPMQDFFAENNSRLPIRWSVYYSASFDIVDSRTNIAPSFLFQYQNPFREIIGGSYLKFKMKGGTKFTGQYSRTYVGFGLFYRSDDALIPKLIYEGGKFSIGLAYDFNISAYRLASRYMGGFEVSLKIHSLAGSLFESQREYTN